MWWRGLDNKGFLLVTNSLQLQKYQRRGQAGRGLRFLPTPHRPAEWGPAWPLGRWKRRPAKGRYLRAGTISLPASPASGGAWAGSRALGGPHPEAQGWPRSAAGTKAPDLGRFLPPPLLPREGWMGGGTGRVLRTPGLGSDSGKPQEVGERT